MRKSVKLKPNWERENVRKYINKIKKKNTEKDEEKSKKSES